MIKLFFLDVDGTLTDGKINISSNGEIYKSFSVKDGLGIKKLMQKGITPIIITGRYSDIVKYRCEELGIKEIYQNISQKKELIEKILIEKNILAEETAYIGDDENDLEAIKLCGVTFAPNDAIKIVKENVDHVMTLNGGNGCVREAIEYILENKCN